MLQAGRGGYIFKLRGVVHTFRNAGTMPTRLIEFMSPAEFEEYFEELANLFRAESSLARQIKKAGCHRNRPYPFSLSTFLLAYLLNLFLYSCTG